MKIDLSTYTPFGLEPIETASRDEIAALQVERLKYTLRTVYEKVPAYRRKFDAAGVSPADFKTLDDLGKFPFTTKHDLRENYPFGLFAVPREKIARVHASSGTTGRGRRWKLAGSKSSWGKRRRGWKACAGPSS